MALLGLAFATGAVVLKRRWKREAQRTQQLRAGGQRAPASILSVPSGSAYNSPGISRVTGQHSSPRR